MSAILLRNAVQQNELEHLQEQLLAGGILQKEYLECTQRYLIREGIYEITHLSEQDFRKYGRVLRTVWGYPRQQSINRTAALRKVHQYWIEKEYQELIEELERYEGIGKEYLGNVKSFLIRQGIHHVREVDYPVRARYEAELYRTISQENVMAYLKVLDRLKQRSIQEEMESLATRTRNWKKYKEEILFLPYCPKQELVKGYFFIQDKSELVWDFSQQGPDTLKRQVHMLLHYILEHVYPDDTKEQRVRFLLPLKWLYEFCVKEGIEDIELLELEQIEDFRMVVEQKVVNVKNSMQIVDNSRKYLFLNAKETNWNANVWYMERFHFTQERLNPSNPVMRLGFLEVTNRRNRKLLQEYAKYLLGLTDLTIGNIRAQIYNVKEFMVYFQKETSVCHIGQEQIDQYFKQVQDTDIKVETFNGKIADTARFYWYLKSKGYIEKLPFAPEYYLVKTYPEHHDRSVEAETCMEILKKLYLFPEIPRLIFLHLWGTGLRISEICTLKGDAYYWDGEDAWLKVYQIKMKADKMIPIPVVLYRIMQIYMEKNRIHANDYVFQAKQGGAYRYGSFLKTFRCYCKKYQISGGEFLFKSHDYRHTLATNFYDKGTSIQTIRDYLGHVTENMTKQYVDYMPKKIAQANEEFFQKPENSLASTITVKKRGGKK